MENDKTSAAKDVLTALGGIYSDVETDDLYKPFDASQKRAEPYVADIKHLSVEELLKGE